MPEDSARRKGSRRDGIATAGIAVLAIGCCAGLPLIAALAGSVAVGTLLGVGAGIVVAVMLVGVVVLRVRGRRRASEAPASHHGPALPRHH